MKSFIKIMVIFMSIILGVFLGSLAEGVSWLSFLNFGMDLGLDNPVTLDLGFMAVTFGLQLKLNIAGILGFVLSMFLVNKVIK